MVIINWKMDNTQLVSGLSQNQKLERHLETGLGMCLYVEQKLLVKMKGQRYVVCVDFSSSMKNNIYFLEGLFSL